jgi:hypothetical protein
MPTKRRVVSLLPDEMSKGGGGLEDRFIATVEEVRCTSWNYGKEGMDPIFAYRVKARPVEDDQVEDAVLPAERLESNGGLVVNHYSSGKLSDWLPSMDGEEPVDVEAEDEDDRLGVFAVPTEALMEKFLRAGGDEEVGPQINRGTNWAFWVQHAIDAGFPKELIAEAQGDCRVFEGGTYRFDRVPGPKRSGVPMSATGDGGSERKGDGKVLVITEIVELPNAAKKGAKKATGASSKATSAAPAKAAASAQTNGSNDVAEQVEAAIIELLSDEKLGGRIPRKKAVSEAIKQLSAKDKPKGLALISGKDYMKFFESSELLILDAETDVIELAE